MNKKNIHHQPPEYVLSDDKMFWIERVITTMMPMGLLIMAFYIEMPQIVTSWHLISITHWWIPLTKGQ